MDDARWLPFLLQTSDALFPTGAYAHSLGFEETVRLGLVHDEASLRAFLLTQIVPAQRQQELPYLRFAFVAARAADLLELCAIDSEISAWKMARETREASAQLGARRLKALQTISTAPLLGSMAEAIAAGGALGHHLVISGMQAAVENVPLAIALTTSFYQTLAAICAAALKLFRIGQDACQRVLRSVSNEAGGAVHASLSIERDRAGWFSPLVDIASMRHERAGERLFIS